MPERARLARDPRRVAGGADRGDRVARPSPSTRTSPTAPRRPACARDGVGLAGEDRLVEPQRLGRLELPVGDDLVARLRAGRGRRRRPPRPRQLRAARRRGRRSRSATTSAESRSSARFARTSCAMPITEFATRTPRKSASCHSPNASVSRAGDGEDQVEDREDVGADDARVGAARPGRLDRAAVGQPALRLGGREPFRTGGRPAIVDGGHRAAPARDGVGARASTTAAAGTVPRVVVLPIADRPLELDARPDRQGNRDNRVVPEHDLMGSGATWGLLRPSASRRSSSSSRR